MPTPPYAKALVSVNGGGVQSGGVVVAGGATIAFSGENTAQWSNQKWELYWYPTDFSAPAGWSTDANGVIFSTAVTPPSFTLPALAAATGWGKYMLRLTVNAGLLGLLPIIDESLALRMLSPKGQTGLGFNETSQFGGARKQVAGELETTLRAIEANLGGGGATPGGSVGQFQWNNTAFAGASQVTTDGTYIGLGPAANLGTTGFVRFQHVAATTENQIVVRYSGTDYNVLRTTSGTVVDIGNTTFNSALTGFQLTLTSNNLPLVGYFGATNVFSLGGATGDFVALGATPPTAGYVRATAPAAATTHLIRIMQAGVEYDAYYIDTAGGQQVLGNTNAHNLVLRGYALSFSSGSGNSISFTAAGTSVAMFSNASAAFNLPIVGNAAAWGSVDGLFTKTLTAAQSYSLLASEYANNVLQFVSNGANTIVLPVATNAQAYKKYVWNQSGGGTISVSNGTQSAAAALASGNGAWFLISATSVKQITAAFTVA